MTSIFCSCGITKESAVAAISTVEDTTESIDDVVNDKLYKYTMPEEIDIHTIDEAKNNSNGEENVHKKAVLDDDFISNYIDIDQFAILKSWVINGITKSKNNFEITEAKFKDLKDDITATYDVLSNSSIDLDSKKQTLYAMLVTVLDKSDLDLSEFETAKKNAKNFGTDK